MAKCEINFPHELEIKLSRCGSRIDEITGKSLEAAAETALPVFKSNLAQSIGDTQFESRSTGELLDSVGISPVEVDKKGIINIKVGFREPRSNQYSAKGKRSYYRITNAMIANVLEYGKHSAHQPPRPFLKRTKAQVKNSCIAAAQKAFDKEFDQL